MDTYEYTTKKLNTRDNRIITRFGHGDTEQGILLTEDYLETYSQLFVTQINKSKKNRGFRGKQRLLVDFEPEKLAAIALNGGVTAIGNDSPTISNVLKHLGTCAFHECYARQFRLWNEEEAKRIEAIVKRNHSSYKQRLAAFRGHTRKTTFEFDQWSHQELLMVGKWLLEVLLDGPAFTVFKEQYVTLTPDAYSRLDDIMAQIVVKRLYGVPKIGEAPVWESSTVHIDDMPYSLIRSYQKPVLAHVERAIKAGSMKPTLSALNAIQSVRWRINEPVLNLIRDCYEHGVKVEGLPSKDDLPEPEKSQAWDDMTEGQRRAWRKKAHDIAIANIGLEGERTIYKSDMAMADSLVGESFTTLSNVDYRGRVYFVPHFNFQRQDRVRALFLFAEGQQVDAEGLYWLKVHLANCGDFGKISKKPFDDRVWWVDDHIDAILATASYPMDDLWWTEADSPFLFVAACMALRDALEGKKVSIPTSFDGSCSGLQHLSMLALCEKTGRLTNLTPLNEVQDVYQTVTDLVNTKVTKDLTSDEILTFTRKDKETKEVLETRHVPVRDVAKLALDYGINRSFCKRPTMTFAYSSKRAGMMDQILEDTMKPLSLKVLSGELEVHPFGDDGGYAAARYLSGVIYNSIVETVERPAEVMRYFQSIARIMAHEGKPTTWTTPLGFPVMLRTPNTQQTQINLFLHDRGIKRRIQPRSTIETQGINKMRAANSVAPSVIHSLDACHLMMVVLAAKTEGINNVALVHDSFGCLPNEASKFRRIIKDQFVKMYAENNVLQDILDENSRHLETNHYRLPDIPKKGLLDLDLVKKSEYSFA